MSNFRTCQNSEDLFDKIYKYNILSLEFSIKTDDGKNILMAHCNKARYLKVKYRLRDCENFCVLKITEYDKIIEVYQRGKRQVAAKLESLVSAYTAYMWDFAQFIMEYITDLKLMENNNRRYYHKTILENYELYINLATNQQRNSLYFEKRIPCIYALVAEYLFGLYRCNKESAVRKAAELSYLKSISLLEREKKLPVVEFLKINLDLVAFYEALIEETSGMDSVKKRHEYYEKIMEVLFRSKAAFLVLKSQDWKYEKPTITMVSTPVSITKILLKMTPTSITNILLKNLQLKLEETFKKRSSRRELNENDISADEYKELLRLCSNEENIPLLYNLNEIFRMAEKSFKPFRNKMFILQ